MADSHAVTISMPPDSAQRLRAWGFHLFVFKAVRTPRANAMPVIWHEPRYAETTVIRWTSEVQAYASHGSPAPVKPGQTLRVTPDAVQVVDDGVLDAVSIANETRTPLIAGLMQEVDGTLRNFCAVRMAPATLEMLTPLEQVVLMFATEVLDTGRVLHQALGPTLWVDLTGVRERAVAYDVNAGWMWGGGSWARVIRLRAELTPLLYVPVE